MDTVSFTSRRAKRITRGDGASPAAGEEKLGTRELEELEALWKAVLRVAAVQHQDNFFELGGTSLHAMMMASKIERSLSLRMSLVAFFEDPTFAGLCYSVTSD